MTTYNPNAFETLEAQAIAVSENVTAAFRDYIKRNAYDAIESVFVDIECNAEEAGDMDGKLLASAKSKYQQAYKKLIDDCEIDGSKLLVWSHAQFAMVPVKFRNTEKKKAEVRSVRWSDIRALCSDLSDKEKRQVVAFIENLKSA